MRSSAFNKLITWIIFGLSTHRYVHQVFDGGCQPLVVPQVGEGVHPHTGPDPRLLGRLVVLHQLVVSGGVYGRGGNLKPSLLQLMFLVIRLNFGLK